MAWQEAKHLAILSRDAIRSLPRIETYALGTQWQRAAYSVALNIAEGASQASRKQFCRYIEIAKGSLDELQGVLDLADALGYLPIAIEHATSDKFLDGIFAENAERQVSSELLFSTVVKLMTLVACRVRPSINAAYQKNAMEITPFNVKNAAFIRRISRGERMLCS